MLTGSKIMLTGACCLSFLTITFQKEAAAVPAYARQTGLSCSACHFQRFPLLNPFGRSFKANGYTLVGGKEGTIEGTDLSIPASLNAAFVSKFKYEKTNGSATTGDAGKLNKGQFLAPDEAILYVSGRVAKNIGFQAEINLAANDGGSVLNGFKMPFVFPTTDDLTFSVIPFVTRDQGPAYGFELLNTGAIEFDRAFEHSGETSAQQYIGSALESTGVALVAYSKMGYLSYTPFIPAYPNNGNTLSQRQILSYVRGVVTPGNVGNFDLAGGFQIWKGNSKSDPASINDLSYHADAWALDAQAQGKVGKYPLGIYVTYGSAAMTSSTLGQTNIFNQPEDPANPGDPIPMKNRKAWTVAADLGIIPSKLSLGAAYRNANSGFGETENALTLAVTYNVAQNVAFQLDHSFYSNDMLDAAGLNQGKQHTTLVMYSAF
jgi:hypothetical protein